MFSTEPFFNQKNILFIYLKYIKKPILSQFISKFYIIGFFSFRKIWSVYEQSMQIWTFHDQLHLFVGESMLDMTTFTLVVNMVLSKH